MMLITVPHSGEMVPPEATWLAAIDPKVLLTDVDRFVHELYGPAAQELSLPLVKAEFHRYAVDLNRTPADVDGTLVEGAMTPPGGASRFVSGFHWAKTTQGAQLLDKPVPRAVHDALVRRYYEPFHEQVRGAEAKLIAQHGLPRYHIDAHSMPSRGTGAHKDAGSLRPDVVVSDCEGKSCEASFKDLVIASYQAQGFKVAYNWPYRGGRMTEQYGRPKEGRHSVQVEINRALYMDEATRAKSDRIGQTTDRVTAALRSITEGIRR